MRLEENFEEDMQLEGRLEWYKKIQVQKEVPVEVEDNSEGKDQKVDTRLEDSSEEDMYYWEEDKEKEQHEGYTVVEVDYLRLVVDTDSFFDSLKYFKGEDDRAKLRKECCGKD